MENRELRQAAAEVWREYYYKFTAPLVFIGQLTRGLPEQLSFRKRRSREFFYYLELCGSRSLGVVLLTSLLMGGVLALQSALQMQKVGTEIFVVDLVGFAVLKEFGPLIVAIIATGRAGSAFAAEIGTMKVNEEISALETMGLDSVSYLVYPKLWAMILALPLLTVFGDIAGIIGGMFIGIPYLGIPATAYWTRTIEVLDGITFILGVLKSVVFAIAITLVGCFCGFQASGDAQGVGRGATNAVVSSIILVVICDAVMTVLYSFVGY